MSSYLLSQLRPIDGAAAPSLKVYPGGHMMYLRPGSRAQLTASVSDLFATGAH
jgi:carboxypeptidase C (cathepsin A)